MALQPTLALRIGGKRVWGQFPYQEAAYIGDDSSVRLGRQNRYGGDASVYANAELRLFLTRFYILVPGEFGVFGLGDVGRVYFDGESSDKWHAAAGGGIWASFLDRANTVSLAVASSSVRTAALLQRRLRVLVAGLGKYETAVGATMTPTAVSSCAVAPVLRCRLARLAWPSESRPDA